MSKGPVLPFCSTMAHSCRMLLYIYLLVLSSLHKHCFLSEIAIELAISEPAISKWLANGKLYCNFTFVSYSQSQNTSKASILQCYKLTYWPSLLKNFWCNKMAHHYLVYRNNSPIILSTCCVIMAVQLVGHTGCVVWPTFNNYMYICIM